MTRSPGTVPDKIQAARLLATPEEWEAWNVWKRGARSDALRPLILSWMRAVQASHIYRR